MRDLRLVVVSIPKIDRKWLEFVVTRMHPHHEKILNRSKVDDLP